MLIAKQHPNGILLVSSELASPELSYVKLRRDLKVPVVPGPNQGAIISLQHAHRLLNHFDVDELEWEPELLGIATSQASQHTSQLRARLEVDWALGNPIDSLAGYPLLHVLDPHQIEAVAAMTVPSLQGIAIFDEQGIGKTIMTLCAFDRLRQHDMIDKLIVVAPKSVLGSWSADTTKLFGEKYDFTLVTGSARQRRQQILAHSDILATSYETVVNELALLRSVISSRNTRYLLVVDESYFAKNPDAQRTQAVSELRAYCDRAIVLCGTPAPNSPHDLVQQVNIADQGVAFGNRPIPKDKDQAFSVIADALGDAIYLRRLKKDVLPNIPEKQIERVLFELQPDQMAMYERARGELILAVRSIDDHEFTRQLTSFLARRSALAQICSHPGAIDPAYAETPAKHLALDRMLHQLIDVKKEKVVIWAYYRYSLDEIAQRYNHYGLVRIDGSVSDTNARIEAIRRFQSDPEVRVFLGNAAAAGAGITLTAARHAIYESFSNQAAHYMQSVDRIHRRGQTRDVFIHVLLGHNTIEEVEFERILDKERSSRDLLGDIYEEPITREQFLADLGVSIRIG